MSTPQAKSKVEKALESQLEKATTDVEYLNRKLAVSEQISNERRNRISAQDKQIQERLDELRALQVDHNALLNNVREYAGRLARALGYIDALTKRQVQIDRPFAASPLQRTDHDQIPF